MKLTIAELRRQMPVGTQFKAAFLPRKNSVTPADTNEYFRIVVKQTPTKMVSKYLEGPREGQEVTCTWRYVVAREENGKIILTHTDQGRSDDFLAIAK